MLTNMVKFPPSLESKGTIGPRELMADLKSILCKVSLAEDLQNACP